MSSNRDHRQLARKRRETFRKLLSQNQTYPLATLTYHGPDADTATKITVGIIRSKAEQPLVRHWEGEGIAENESAALEISRFLEEHAVERVITSENVMSCPHQEGVDYPAGEDCPYCDFWKTERNTQKEENKS